MTMSVRHARDDDRSFIDDLGAQTAHATLGPVRVVSNEVAKQAYKRLMAFCRERFGTITLIAESDGNRAGFLTLLTDVPEEATQTPQAFIAYLAVAEEQRGRGAGRALVQAAIRESERRGLPNICLMVSADNATAQMLYESEHFLEERILMTKPLGVGVPS